MGDRLSSDILGGINAGIRTCWFNPKGEAPDPEIPADYEIRQLSELSALLEKRETFIVSRFYIFQFRPWHPP